MGEKLPAKAADNWDLQAVVGCFFNAYDSTGPPQINTTTTTTNNSTVDVLAANENSSDPLAFLANMEFDEEEDPFSFPILLEKNNNGFDELENSYRSFFPTPSSFPEGLTCHQQQLNTSAVSPVNSSSFLPLVDGEQNNQHTQQTHHLQQPQQTQHTHHVQQVLQQQPLIQQQKPQIPQQAQHTHHVQQVLQQQPLIQQQQQQIQQQPPLIQQQQPQNPQQQPQIQQQQPIMISSVIPLRPMMPPRSRKRKTPIKKMVCQFTFEQLSSDTWSWRKYGQKPIKGSPYPRNYFRCSTTRACGARRQVERSNTNSSIYIVSYTGDHTHPRPTQRNSLAGSTRHKFSRTNQTRVTTTSVSPPQPPAIASDSSSSPLAATCQPPTASPVPTVEEMLNTIENSHTKEADLKDNKGFMEEEEEVDDLLEDLLIQSAPSEIDEDFFKGLKLFDTTTAASGSGGSENLAASEIDEDFFEGLKLFDTTTSASSSGRNENLAASEINENFFEGLKLFDTTTAASGIDGNER